MERYRVSLIFAAADIDTYGCIAAFAKKTTRATRMAFEYLLHRADTRVKWEALTLAKQRDTFSMAHDLRLGRYAVATKPTTEEPRTEAEMVRMYTDALKATGHKLDPSIFMNNDEPRAGTADAT